VEYWINNRGFKLSGTADKDVMLASNERKRQYLLIRYYWITDEYRQATPIVHSPEDALALLSEPVAA
jgi:hypothetical protein